MSWFYAFTIYPLELAYKGIFTLCSDILGSYGLALIALSLCTSFAIAPLKKAVSAAMRKEQELQLVLQPQLKKIREEAKGAERHARTMRLYRRYAYHPIMGIRSILGVALQIPFLMAAYYMVEGLEVLKGQSFWFLTDLSLPDGLLGGINLLPIVMTLVNLGAVFTSPQMARKDRMQACVVAFLFLVLLYGAPSALLFYWTLNNILSLVEGLIQKNCSMRPGWAAFERRLADAWDRLGQKAGAFWARVRTSRFPRPAYLRAFIALAAVIGIAFIIVRYGFQKGDITKAVTKTVTLSVITLAALWGGTLWGKLRGKVLAQKKDLDALFLPAVGLIAFLIFVYCPFMVFSSDPVVFDMKLEDFASGRLGAFFVVMIALSVIHALIRPVRWAFGAMFTVLAFAALTFCFVVAPDVGIMDAFILQKAEVLTRWQNVFIDTAVFAAVGLTFVAAVRFCKVKVLTNVVYAALTVLIVMTGVHYQTAKNILADGSQHAPAGSEGMEVPQYVKDFFTFSKNGKNIVVVMLDMFTGGNMNQILEAHPELKNELDGFTWYEDVVTSGPSTIFGKPGILGGEACTPALLNKDTSRTLEEKIAEAHGTFFRKLQEQGFTLSVAEKQFFHPELLDKHLLPGRKTNFVVCKDYTLWKNASLRWARKNDFTVGELQSYDKFWIVMGLFNAFPLTGKDAFYDKGRWKKSISRGNKAIRWATDQIAGLDLPSYASIVSEERKNAFIYMINLLTHVPWAIDENGMPCQRDGWGSSCDLNNGGLSQEHLRTEYYALKALIPWFRWMKEQDVYDNTQIILVSDHGRGDSMELVKAWNGFPPISLHGLLLVKETGKRGELRIDRTTQMANWDVPHIIQNGLCKDPGEIKRPWDEQRTRFSANAKAWRREGHEKNRFLFNGVYKIQGPLYDKKSWVKVN